MAVTRRGLLSALGRRLGLASAMPVLAACAALTGRTAGPPAVKFGDPLTLVFWHSHTGEHEKALSEIVAKFNSANGKNITLRSEYQGPYPQVFQRTMMAIQAGSPPDAALAFEGMVQEYARSGAVVDLDEYLTQGPAALTKESLNDLVPAYLQSGRLEAFKRRLHSFPFAKSLAVHYYNEDLLRDAGWEKSSGLSFDEFKRQVGAVTKKDGNGTTVYGHHIRVDASYVDAFIYANGGELLTKDLGKVRFHEPAGVEVFEMWGEMVKQGQAYTARGFNYQSDFGQGKVAGLHDTSASRPFIAAETIDHSAATPRFQWGIGMIPQRDPAKPVTVTFGANLSVFKSTPLKQAAAWEWIKFFSERDQTVAWSIKSSYMPVRKSAAEHSDMKAFWLQHPPAEQAFRLAQYARPEPSIAAWQEIRELLTNALSAVIAQRVPAKAALEEAARQANRLIEARR
ncbi:MAG TPA: ABC transporter substrate-binding protein [Chloroflexota bacterium]|nr:ABC transporter substrate-binding protein [Chloroflexota bacterium]